MTIRLLRLICALAMLAAPSLMAARAQTDVNVIARGAYIARLGDCAACHTTPGGTPFAGGRPMPTPFGVVYASNITPDKQTGIGNYSFDQFDRAVRRGVSAKGAYLYPAMPYTSYAKVTTTDMKALYAYMMAGVAPVQQANRKPRMMWPFSMRIGMLFWDKLFFNEAAYQPDPRQSSQWNRGAYLVQGLGHCGACHTPRGLGMQEKATDGQSAQGEAFLAGAVIENWYAPSLRGLWSAPEMVDFLGKGFNRHAAAYGSMTEVVHVSTQYFTADDLNAVAAYLGSLRPTATKPNPAAQIAGDALYKTPGGLAYLQFCAACHQGDGSGVAGLFPPLAGNASVTTGNPSSVLHVMLAGGQEAATQGAPHALFMPAFARLNDHELASIASFVRGSWGNNAPAIAAADVGKMRDVLAIKVTPASPAELPRFADLPAQNNADQLIYGMRLVRETKTLLPDHVGDVLSCDSCHFNGGTMAHGSPFIGLVADFPIYAPRAGKIIDVEDRLNACFRRSMNGTALDKNSTAMKVMVAYFNWMRDGIKKGDPIPGRGFVAVNQGIIADPKNGEIIYKKQCAFCHGQSGEGRQRADGSYDIPPLWGEHSFNIGAGLARLTKAASLVKADMPIGNNSNFPLGQGGLTDQEAFDVAAYFTAMPRPDYADKAKDWPNGGKPRDARY